MKNKKINRTRWNLSSLKRILHTGLKIGMANHHSEKLNLTKLH
jgi:hypothetical protein